LNFFGEKLSELVRIEPENGWNSFKKSEELVAAIWQGLTEENGQWHYINVTNQSSIWESCIDGSAISMWHDADGKLIELHISFGAALIYMMPILEDFQLFSYPL
jgi:hypothetical protein